MTGQGLTVAGSTDHVGSRAACKGGAVVDIDVREASDVPRPAISACQMAQRPDDCGGQEHCVEAFGQSNRDNGCPVVWQ